MPQIRFRLGLRPTPHWGSQQRFPRFPSWIFGSSTSKEKDGREKGKDRRKQGRSKGGEREIGEMKWERKRRGRKTRLPQLKFLATPLLPYNLP